MGRFYIVETDVQGNPPFSKKINCQFNVKICQCLSSSFDVLFLVGWFVCLFLVR